MSIKSWRGRVHAVVNEQAENDGLWFIAKTAAEGYLQQELRRLHAVIEGTNPPRTEQEIFDPSDTIYPDHYFPVPDRIIGNILDHWDLIENDTKSYLENEVSGFYKAMQELNAWMYKNR